MWLPVDCTLPVCGSFQTPLSRTQDCADHHSPLKTTPLHAHSTHAPHVSRGSLKVSCPKSSGGGFVEAFELKREEITDWNTYPFNIPCIQKMERVELHPAVTFFVGENGSGKSTLLEAMAVRSRLSARKAAAEFFQFSPRRTTHSTLSHRASSLHVAPNGNRIISFCEPRAFIL